MDASVVITMEWHDKNLEWKTGKIELLDKQKNQTDEVLTSSDDKTQAGNKTESIDDSKGQLILLENQMHSFVEFNPL